MKYETDSQAALTAEELPQPRRSGMMKLSLALFALMLLIAAGFVLWAQYFAEKDEQDLSEQAQMVTVVVPTATQQRTQIIVNGTLSARRELPVGVAGEGGRVVSVPVNTGDWVKAGQVLAVIDRSVQTQQASSAAAQVDVSRADARLAQANLDRALKLVDRGFISTADIDRLTATRDAAIARVKVAQARLNELHARNARLNVVAPTAGLVLQRKVEPGQIVSGGTGALFLIAEKGAMALNAQLGEADLARVAVGDLAQVTPTGMDKSFTGKIWEVSPVIDAQSRQGKARIALGASPDLRPGGFATAVIDSGVVVAPMLPESAIQSGNEGSYVYIVGKDNKVSRRPIKTGMVTPEGIAVTEGLNGSEKVVMLAGGFLNPGETVRVKLYRPDAPETDGPAQKFQDAASNGPSEKR